MPPAAPARRDYGLDAPRLARGFFIAGGVAARVATGLRLADVGWPIARARLGLFSFGSLRPGAIIARRATPSGRRAATAENAGSPRP